MVSAILATYNEIKNPLLPKVLESVARQTYDKIEFVIVDDASTDGTALILENFKKKHPTKRIRIFHNRENRGAHYSYLEGIRKSKGKYIGWIGGSDDVNDPTRFEKQVRFLEKNPDAAAVGSWYTYVRLDGEPIAKMKPPIYPEQVYKEAYESSIHFATMLARRNVFDSINLHSHSAGDVEFRLELLKEGFQVYNIPEYLVKVCRREGSLISRSRRRVAIDSLMVELRYLPHFLNLTSLKRIFKHILIIVIPSKLNYIAADYRYKMKG